MLPSLEPQLHTPERLPFVRKLVNFLDDHGFAQAPTLAVQCAPTEEVTINSMAARVDQTLLQGSGMRIDQTWWDGFAGGTRKAMFDGHASVDGATTPNWVVELQDDGHILAAVRAVPFEDADGIFPAIVHVFDDFAVLARRLRSSASIEGAATITATLINAKGQQLLNDGHRLRARPRSITRETLEWPILTALTADEIEPVCDSLKARLKRIFP